MTRRSAGAPVNAPVPLAAPEAVTNIRHLFQGTVETDFKNAVERLTGRTVVAFISGNHVDPDIAAELFILDGAL